MSKVKYTHKITEDEFYELFTPIKNKFDDNASFDGCLHETYGEEIAFVLEMAKLNRVVTIIEGEDKDDENGEVDEDGDIITHSTLFYSSGYHLVNRLGFLILDKPYEFEFEVAVD